MYAIEIQRNKCWYKHDWLTTHITNCLRGIRNAWHFHYALVSVFKVVYGGFSIALLTP
ncbi:DUF3265 domain-containing protein [Vibrio parahaemolyticus]|uniref:DUF3265 domain-containing protein n=1 Tax=Vibrio parahaemolyticus TaxID=670 RepID=A0AA46QRK6_VIBPH|nr:DUF3265 domain-containing protein [Vibrio parahaemolyticus]